MMTTNEANNLLDRLKRLNHDAEVVECAIDGYERGNEFEGKSVDVCIGIIGRRAEEADRVLGAAGALQIFVQEDDNYTNPNDPDPYAAQVEMGLALEAYDKETKT